MNGPTALSKTYCCQGVYIPEMVPELTTQRVLTMEWVEGVRLRSAGEDPSAGRALNPEDMRLVGVRPFHLTAHSFDSQHNRLNIEKRRAGSGVKRFISKDVW